jgi:RNA polymerase sigma-70 factor (ECF subfamily)
MKSWLFTIMRNAFYTRLKDNKRETPGSADCISGNPARDATQEWSARGREIADAIQRLPREQREVVMLIGVLGVSYEEAASICGCAIGTVKSRLNRARLRLLKELREDSVASSLQGSISHPIISLPRRPS